MPKLIYVSVVKPNKNSEIDAILLAESIRAFSGKMSSNPIWFLTVDNLAISEQAKNKFKQLSVELMPFEPVNDDFFFLNEVKAAAKAEYLALQNASLIAWLGSNSIILKEPNEFILKNGKNLGYRPVHHTLIGSKYDKPIDEFWNEIYKFCKVEEAKLFPITTHVDDQIIRPYFNAGLLISRPEKRLFKLWYEKLEEAHQSPTFQKFYEKDQRYIIFLHQAILTGIILANNKIQELVELPSSYNYPIHLFDKDITKTRPSTLEELTTIRHEGFYNKLNWEDNIRAGEFLKKWFKEHILT
ncbi:MAG: hypothetical protein MUO21_11980 [Nitrososphaeraceae archaeon]|nr:hypothetical protein [Nitrososphaeraceae archaeon]